MYQHIMVPLDGSELAECVFPHVESIGTGCNVNRVTLVRVVHLLGVYGYTDYRFSPADRKDIEAKGKENALKYLEQVEARLKEKGIATDSVCLLGDTVEELVNYASNNEVDLIVISTHGHSGISKWVWGNIADRLLRSAHVPVLMVRAPGSVPGI